MGHKHGVSEAFLNYSQKGLAFVSIFAWKMKPEMILCK
jgi:hypothetical protein